MRTIIDHPTEEESHSETTTSELSKTIYQHYSVILQNSTLRKEFQEYLTQSVCSRHLILLNIIFTVLIYPQFIVQSRETDTMITFGLKIFEIIFAIVTFLTNWSFCFITVIPPFRTSIRWSKKKHRLLQGASILLMTMVLSFNLLRRASATFINDGNATDFLSILKSSYGNIYQNVQVFPMDSALWLTLAPIAQTIVTREYRVSVLLFVYLVSLFAMCFASIYWHYSSYVIPIIVAYGSFGGMILLDYLQQHLLLFFLHRELVTKLLEQERSAEEVRRKEMRHMIANVAHDLKSPLSSFMNGIEVIQDDLRIIRSAIQQDMSVIPRAGQESLSSIDATIHYIQNVNNFMLMTINRCLDTTKASSGLKLVPKFETISLPETLSLPLECMTNTQQKIEIKLLPWDKRRICSYVLTDKQWLQENILCLLSNAVKYSPEGEVTVSVELKAKDAFLSMQSKEEDFKTKDAQNENPRNSPNQLKSELIRTSSVLNSPIQKKSTPSGSSLATGKKPNTLMSLLTLSKYKIVPDLPLPETQTRHERAPEERKMRSRSVVNSIRSLYNVISTNDSRHDNCENYLVFSIEDMGIGMSDDARKELFSPFTQNQRLAGGTGLGLYSLSKRLEALKGYYGVEKRKDGKQGSLFWFAIPYKPDPDAAKMSGRSAATEDELHEVTRVHRTRMIARHSFENSVSIPTERIMSNNHLPNNAFPHRDTIATPPNTLSPPPRTGGGATEHKGYAILIADDAVTVAKMMKKLLERHGHQVTVVDNGAVAFNTVQHLTQSAVDVESTERYDVVLMDLQMPVMDGIEATKRIRAFEKEINSKCQRNFHQLIICVSGNSDNEIVEEAREAGIDAFIPKPFSYETFHTTIEYLLSQVEN